MFGSGKKKRAQHKAQEAQAKAYYAALQKTEALDNPQKAETRNAMQVRENFPDADGYTQSLAYTADKLARGYNEKLPELQEGISAYNDRYEKMQRQMRGESIDDGFSVAGPVSGQNGMLAAINNQPTKFDTLDQATTFANTPAKTPATIGMGNLAGNTTTQAPSMAMQDQQSAVPASITKVTQGRIGQDRGTLNANKDAYDDLSKLSDNISKQTETAGLSNYQAQYDTIAERIRGSLKRNQSPVKPVGLLNSELASSGLKSTQELMSM